MSGTTLKRVLVGVPKASAQLQHTLLPKWMALPVFSSDPMSSTADATQEMMLVLVLAGPRRPRTSFPWPRASPRCSSWW